MTAGWWEAGCSFRLSEMEKDEFLIGSPSGIYLLLLNCTEV